MKNTTDQPLETLTDDQLRAIAGDGYYESRSTRALRAEVELMERAGASEGNEAALHGQDIILDIIERRS